MNNRPSLRNGAKIIFDGLRESFKALCWHINHFVTHWPWAAVAVILTVSIIINVLAMVKYKTEKANAEYARDSVILMMDKLGY